MSVNKQDNHERECDIMPSDKPASLQIAIENNIKAARILAEEIDNAPPMWREHFQGIRDRLLV